MTCPRCAELERAIRAVLEHEESRPEDQRSEYTAFALEAALALEEPEPDRQG